MSRRVASIERGHPTSLPPAFFPVRAAVGVAASRKSLPACAGSRGSATPAAELGASLRRRRRFGLGRTGVFEGGAMRAGVRRALSRSAGSNFPVGVIRSGVT